MSNSNSDTVHPIAPNERKPRERQPPMCDAQRACHRTRAGRGVVGRLMKGKAGKL